MRRKGFWIAASCILALAGLLPVFSSGASPVSKASKQPAAEEKVIYSFHGGSDGAGPGPLTLDAAGNLYGATGGGGIGTGCGGGPCGTVFELERTEDGWKKRTLYSFRGGNDGGWPGAGVIFDNSGNLYGTTSVAGSGNAGTVFKLAPSSKGEWTESVIYSFSSYGGAGGSPQTDLVFDNQGNLYGTTSNGGSGAGCFGDNGCGAVFELTPHADGSWTETTIHSFAPPPDGGNPSSGVILDSAGNLYGMTEYGGTSLCRPFTDLAFTDLDCGVVYKLTPPKSGGNWTESIVYNFARGGGHAVYPSGGLLFDRGDLFGTSQAGGNGWGTVFELHPQQDGSWRQSDPHLFYGNPDGREAPMQVESVLGRLVMDEKADLFGVNSWGGANGSGVVFELQRMKDGWRPRILHAFASSGDNFNIKTELVLGSQGHLYGATRAGGIETACNGVGCGTVYEVTP
jgi:uncharacterized repeat protein (TIGR03803 family)